MKSLKMLMLPGMALGVSAVLCAADAKSASAPAPEAQAAGQDVLAQMNEQPQGTPAEQAFAFLPDVVAKIGDKEITKQEIINVLKAQMPNGMLPAQFPLPMLKQIAPQIVERYVREQLVEKAIQDAKITVTPEEAAAKLRAQFDKMPKEQREMVEQAVKSQGKSIDEIIKTEAADPEVLKGVRIEKLFTANKLVSDSIDPEEVKKFYDEHPERFTQPGDAEDSIRASHILIKVAEGADQKAWDAAKSKLEGIKAELDKGADFGKLAEANSDCPSGKQAQGSLGAFGKGQMVKEFEDAAFALKEGEISGPVKTQFGYHLIRRDAAQKSRQLSFDEVKDRLEPALLQQKNAEAVNSFLDKLMKDAKVEIFVKAPEMPAAAPAAK